MSSEFLKLHIGACNLLHQTSKQKAIITDAQQLIANEYTNQQLSRQLEEVTNRLLELENKMSTLLQIERKKMNLLTWLQSNQGHFVPSETFTSFKENIETLAEHIETFLMAQGEKLAFLVKEAIKELMGDNECHLPICVFAKKKTEIYIFEEVAPEDESIAQFTKRKRVEKQWRIMTHHEFEKWIYSIGKKYLTPFLTLQFEDCQKKNDVLKQIMQYNKINVVEIKAWFLQQYAREIKAFVELELREP